VCTVFVEGGGGCGGGVSRNHFYHESKIQSVTSAWQHGILVNYLELYTVVVPVIFLVSVFYQYQWVTVKIGIKFRPHLFRLYLDRV
jgi:hypothetical protein